MSTSKSSSKRPHVHAGIDAPAVPTSVDIFDTTLRDGSQQEGLSLTVDDKLRGPWSNWII